MYTFDRPSARIMAVIGVLMLGFIQGACATGDDSDVVRPAGQESSSAGEPVPTRTGDNAVSTELDPAQRAALGGRVVFLGEAAMFSAQVSGPERNPMGMNDPRAPQDAQFCLNVVRWLTGVLDP